MPRALAYLSVLAVACGGHNTGSTLAKPGGDADDGAGQLATASAQILIGSDDGSGFGSDQRPRRYRYDDDGVYGGSAYGGSPYGGGAYGGYLYGNLAQPNMYNTPPVPANPYAGAGVTDGGAITGTVRWPHAPAAAATLALACGTVPNPTLALGHGDGAADTVVYLARIDHGRPFPVGTRTLQVGGQIERHGCALEPTVQVATPVPSVLTVVNGDATAITLSAGAAGHAKSLALDEGASRTVATVVGPLPIADQAGGLVPAWVVGVPHPYYTLTDGDGRFRLDEVPPGAYELVVWHAPVVVGVKDGKVVLTAPAEVRRQVIVKPMAPTAVAIDLPAVK